MERSGRVKVTLTLFILSVVRAKCIGPLRLHYAVYVDPLARSARGFGNPGYDSE